jgi:hypothetical protein
MKTRADLEVKRQQAAYYMQLRLGHAAEQRAKGLPEVELPKELLEPSHVFPAFKMAEEEEEEASSDTDSDSDRQAPTVQR